MAQSSATNHLMVWGITSLRRTVHLLYKSEKETLCCDAFIVRTRAREENDDAPDEDASCRSFACKENRRKNSVVW